MILADATIWLFLSLPVPALLLVILGPDNQKIIHLHQIIGDYSRTSSVSVLESIPWCSISALASDCILPHVPYNQKNT
jgi:hypothetical protein